MAARLVEHVGGQPVLVVEDDEICAAVLCDTLALLGLPAVVAHTAEEAESMFDDRQPRAVITDNIMPGKGGHWLASWVKEHSPQTPVIMVSAMPPEAAAQCCVTLLPKPARISELRDALARAGVLPEE